MNQEYNSIVAKLLGVAAVLLACVVLPVSATDDMDPRVAASINERIQPIGQVRTGKINVAKASAAASKVDAKGAYTSACFACHGTGAAGAPKLGDKAAWKARIAQGSATLNSHAIKGFKGMPPKGGSSLDDATVKAIVDYMVAQSK